MKRFVFLPLALLVSNSFGATIEGVRQTVDPETCFLEVVRGMKSIDNPRLIRFNCSMRYIRMVESSARRVGAEGAAMASLTILPYSYELMEKTIRLVFLNNTNITVISANIEFSIGSESKSNSITLYANSPVSPHNSGELLAAFPLNESISSWKLVSLTGIVQ